MLSKCANPACDARFQYLHIGKLFAIEVRRCTQARMPISTEPVRTNDESRYFWLCSTCCKSMTIQLSRAGGIRLAPAANPNEIDPPQVGNGIADGEMCRSETIELSGCAIMTRKQELGELSKELKFLDSGGYRQPMGWRAALIFEDSPVCPKPPFSACPNCQCALLNFVPEGERTQAIPCQHIPLNEAGETLCTMYNTATIDEIEHALREWLHKRIAEIASVVDVELIQNKQNVA
jgi:hypothetical protein